MLELFRQYSKFLLEVFLGKARLAMLVCICPESLVGEKMKVVFNKHNRGFCLQCVSSWPPRDPWCHMRSWGSSSQIGGKEEDLSPTSQYLSKQRRNVGWLLPLYLSFPRAPTLSCCLCDRQRFQILQCIRASSWRKEISQQLWSWGGLKLDVFLASQHCLYCSDSHSRR